MKNSARENAAAPHHLRVSDLLTEGHIVFFPAGAPKPQVFEKLIETLKLPDPPLALKAILDRELWGSTLIAPGLALPCGSGTAAPGHAAPGQTSFLSFRPCDWTNKLKFEVCPAE